MSYTGGLGRYAEMLFLWKEAKARLRNSSPVAVYISAMNA